MGSANRIRQRSPICFLPLINFGKAGAFVYFLVFFRPEKIIFSLDE